MHCALIPLLLLTWTPPPGSHYERLSEKDNIERWRSTESGPSFELNTEGMVESSMLKIAAILFDSERFPDWNHGSVESYELKRLSPLHILVYRRTTTPAPFVADRDCVLDAQLLRVENSNDLLWDVFLSDNSVKGLVDGVVRLAAVHGVFTLHPVDASHTWVSYHLKSNPGGSLPNWVMPFAADDLSLTTIRGLRQESTKGGYEPLMKHIASNFDWSGIPMPKGFEAAPAAPQTPTAADEPHP